MTELLELAAELADALVPFGLSGGPPAGLALQIPVALVIDGQPLTITLTSAHLEQAYLAFVHHYQAQLDSDHTPTISRAKKAYNALLSRPWRVVAPDEVTHNIMDLEAGTALLLPGSGAHTYQVDDRDCRLRGITTSKGKPSYCPDSIFASVRKRASETLPIGCYHTIAREIARIAAVLACEEARSSIELPTLSDTPDTGTASTIVPACDLWAACFLSQRAGSDVRIQITDGRLLLGCEKRHIALEGISERVASVFISAGDFARHFWEPLSEHANRLGDTPVEVAIDLTDDDPVVSFSAEHFGAIGPARRLTH